MSEQDPDAFETSAQCCSIGDTRNPDGAVRMTRRARKAQMMALEKIVETRIIPRLLVADFQPDGLTDAQVQQRNQMLAKKVGEFSELIVDRDAQSSIEYFRMLMAGGASVEALFQDLLAPAAFRLGELWDEDINDFMDVTRGFAHLQQIVHTFSEDFRVEGRNPIANRRALLMPLPGEQHVFGVSMVGQYFRREGWRVWGGPPKSLDEIVELVESQWFDMVGLSASAVKDEKALAYVISSIRSASINKDVAILIGGHVFNKHPELVAAVGADSTAVDGMQAISRVYEKIGKPTRPVHKPSR